MRGLLHPARPGGEREGGGAVSGRNREDPGGGGRKPGGIDPVGVTHFLISTERSIYNNSRINIRGPPFADL